ncbi:MAG TPA: HDOD domain-containing protein [Burkholderiales bacterium]|nr:HDOD domain-containing protein [Burkholderiales bacterium]
MNEKNINALVVYLTRIELPILKKTADEIERLRNIEDSITGKDLSSVILHDPLMVIKVLRFIESRRKSDMVEITTISHAIMMMGTGAFFEHFSAFETVENLLADNPAALSGMLSVISRSRHAALYAQDWSILRHDLESDEVTIAALLHDMAEMLLWCYSPDNLIEIRRRMMRDASLRSGDTQRAVLGFDLLKLQLLLAAVWKLPSLLRSLMDTNHAHLPRVINVNIATALARHSAYGWHNAALPDDYAAINDFLNIGDEAVMHNINRNALFAAKEWKWYNYRPAAAWLPLLQGEWPVE